MNKTNFERVTMILKSAGFITNRLIGGQNTVNFAYILYLQAKKEGMQSAETERIIRNKLYKNHILTKEFMEKHGYPLQAVDIFLPEKYDLI